jgi:beta-aspartyl-peptidase (threonine type)
MKFTIAIHGGAGTILKSEMTPELERDYREGLRLALHTGYTILEKGGACDRCGHCRNSNPGRQYFI